MEPVAGLVSVYAGRGERIVVCYYYYGKKYSINIILQIYFDFACGRMHVYNVYACACAR